jgi:phage protein D/phage baseplate assembly protein gpV
VAPTALLAQCTIKIGGSQVSEELMADLKRVAVDSSLHLPSMFTIELHDPELKWVDESTLAIGSAVEIAVEQPDELGGTTGTIISGEITALEPEFSARGRTVLLIRGYDKSHRLHRGRKIRTFLKQKDSDIVSTIAGEAGLSAAVDTTTVTYDYVLQNNQTNMEFLLSRAERIGYQVYVADGKLCFKKGDASRATGPELALGEELIEFRPCWTATHQADTFAVQGWDITTKEMVKHTESAPDAATQQGGMTTAGGAVAKQAFGAAEALLTDEPVSTADEAKALALGLRGDVGRAFVEAEGTCIGDPSIVAGVRITIKGVGQRFSGTYFVTSATHVYELGDYSVRFGISGRHPQTVSSLVAGGEEREWGRVRGVVTGLVTNLNDPDDLGRVKVKYAWLGDIESDWVRIAAPMAGPTRGFYYLPEVNDEVLVAFEQGDVHHGYIVGALWNGKDKPPKPNSEVTSEGVVNQRIVQSRSGHTVILDDTNGAEQIIIRDKTGKNEMIIDSSQNSMSINVDGDFSVTAKGKITLSSTKDMELASKANGTVKAQSNLDLKAQSNLTAEGTSSAKVKGAQLGLEGTTKGELKGITVSVNGSAMTEIKGGLVKIN